MAIAITLNLVSSLLLSTPVRAAPGSPLLLIYDPASSNPFGSYFKEMLNAEGVKDYEVLPLADLNSTLLAGRRAVLLAESSPTSDQITALTNFVSGGGGLIAMKPVAGLSTILGISQQSGTTADGYMKITDANYGAGLYADTMQFHGSANHYSLAGASQVARIYSDETTATSWPAVTVNTYGSGTAAAFAYDLARSVALTRQGNPANANVDADGDGYFRTIDLFYGGWTDLNRTFVPQADEQVRLLVRLIQTAMGMPIPRLWYFPNGAPTVLVSTGDAHANPDSYYQSEVDDLKQAGATMTFYMAPAGNPSASTVQGWAAQGFDFSNHPYVDCGYQCGFQAAFDWFQSTYGFSPKTVRTHMIRWYGWADAATVENQFGVQMDFNFYTWGKWVNAPGGGPALGYITGSGQPMPYVDASGNVIPVFQQQTVLIDEELAPQVGLAGLSLSQAEAASKSVIDASVNDYHEPITTQFHVDYYFPPVSDWDIYTATYAMQQGAIPLNANAWNTFVQQRWATTIANSTWSNNTLSFDVTAGGPGQTMLVPLTTSGVTLASVTANGSAVSYTTTTIDGTPYAMVPVSSARYVATYAPDTAAPTVSSTTPASGATGVNVDASISVTFSKVMNRDSAQAAFSLSPSTTGTFSWDGTGQTMTFTPSSTLSPQTTYTATESTGAKDLSGNALANPFTWSFTTGSPTPPTVTGVSPNSGPTAGGTDVTVTGTGFTFGATVSFGGTAASNVSIQSSTSLTATTPSHAAGTVDVTVTTTNGTSATSPADQYTFVAPTGTPTVTAVDPGTGPASGGTTVTITGTNFAPGATVTIGGVAATGVTIVNNTTITATTPARAAGGADVVVTSNGQDATLSGGYVYVACPSGCLTDTTAANFGAGTAQSGSYVAQTADGEVSLAPAAGSEFSGSVLPSGWSASPWASGGGATVATGTVTIDGALLATTSYFSPGGSLEFVATFDPSAPYQHVGFGTDLNSAPWAIFSTGSSGGALYARTNAGSGSSDTPLLGNWLGSSHRFRIVWTSTSVTYYIDGTQVAQHTLAITGQMRPVASDAGVGGGVLTLNWLRLSPYASSGTFLSRVLDSGGNATWNTLAWTADLPASTGLMASVRTGNTPTPDGSWSDFSPATSGASLGVTGRYLQYQLNLSTSDPTQTPVFRDLTVGYTLAPFTAPAPTVSAISPTSGTTAGGTQVTITGTNFASGAVVTFGGVAATNATVTNSTTMTANTPAHAAGAVDVMVVNPDGQSATLSGGFTYVTPPAPAPTVTGINPTSGPTTGGTQVTVMGTNFTGATQVSFGSTTAAAFTVSSDTSITATSPAHAAGVVDVTVTTASGPSATGSADQFTFILPAGAPALAAADPGTGPTSGGTTITLTGSNFASGATVTIGGTAATNVTVVNSTTITATAPAGGAGSADVVVTNPDTLSATLSGGYTYIVCLSGCLTDTTAANFSAGTPNSGTYVSQTADGEVSLAPTVGAEFSGSALPNGWSASPWATGGGATVATGTVTVDGALLATTGYFNSGIALDFVATFDASAPFQHAGLGTDLNGSPWAIFSTGSSGGALYARTNAGSSWGETQLSGNWLGSPHHFRIVWTSSSVTYFIDGTQVAQHALSITGQMRPVVSDGGGGGAVLTVDWLRLSPYAGSGSFLSRVLDSGGNVTWGTIAWTADLPASTALTVSVRTGNTPTPDGTWSAFSPATNGATLNLTGRYLQYQLSLSTSDNTQTPIFRDLTLGYTLLSAPTVTGISPTSGPAAGGTAVTLTGTGFTGATQVSFGGTAAASFTVNSDTSITATSPAHPAGTVDVTVTGPGGTSATSPADQFTYVAAPTVTAISPTGGPTTGGTTVTISGTGFTGATQVTFGSIPAASFTVNSDTSITAMSPAEAAGTVDITVTTSSGTSATSSADQFTYAAAPTLTGLSPPSGSTAGGTVVAISGTGFAGATQVNFGTTATTTFSVISETAISATSPAHAAGTVDITVTTPGGTSTTSSASQFTYVDPPRVTGLRPTFGPRTGGTTVLITGTNFRDVTQITFGGIPVTNFSVVSPTSISAVSPAHSAGTVSVIVTTRYGSSAPSRASRFRYV